MYDDLMIWKISFDREIVASDSRSTNEDNESYNNEDSVDESVLKLSEALNTEKHNDIS